MMHTAFPSFRRPTQSSGSSLLEVTVVLLLLGIVAAVAQPKFSEALGGYRVEAAASRIRSDLEYAKSLARVRSQLTTVRFATTDQPNGNFYRFESLPAPGVPTNGFDASDEATWYRVDLTEHPYGVELRSAPLSITFDLYGIPSESSTIVLGLGAQTRTIRVTGGSGEIFVE